MPSLIDLPLEIRVMVFKEVINGHRTPPISPSKSNMVEITDTECTASNGHPKFNHEKHDRHSPSNSLPLLLTSRQVSVDTQSILNRMKKIIYVLDFSILNEQDMFSTWISVPHLTTRLSTLYIDLRLFGHILTCNDVKQARERGGRGGGYNTINWLFPAFLDRFLLHGPVGEKKGGSVNSYEDRVITVENLIFDFHSAETKLPFPPLDIEYQHWLDNGPTDPLYIRMSEMSEDLKYKARPHWPLRSWTEWLRDITNMGYITEKHAGLIYERIGTISMLLNGRRMTTVDIADRLAKVLIQSPLYTMDQRYWGVGVSGFQKWGETVLLKREVLNSLLCSHRT
ncbi:hypothetical protein N7519_005243 [Penicillium mononematosum]|uniref:uncharacterized protein n=1 Tax=Penicillium mononematosum TaxID=268346 RepID=UPI0025474C32|nr:uncharacterized protein N7519_005243 [Penicillium mononematosum]KAJ6183942.1 hypothetical protein N7519_005243 [Penicillium mononematosum]